MAYKVEDFIEKHIFYAYLNVKAYPVVNGVELVDEAVFQKSVIDGLALLGSHTYKAGYVHLDGDARYPSTTSAESGTATAMRFEALPDGLGLAKITAGGGGLAPVPAGWKRELSGLYVAGPELFSVIVPAGGVVALWAPDANKIFGFSIDGAPSDVRLIKGGSATPTFTAYRVDDSGNIYTDDLGGGEVALTWIDKAGIYLVEYLSVGYYLLFKAGASDLTITTVNEIVQIVEVAS